MATQSAFPRQHPFLPELKQVIPQSCGKWWNFWWVCLSLGWLMTSAEFRNAAAELTGCSIPQNPMQERNIILCPSDVYKWCGPATGAMQAQLSLEAVWWCKPQYVSGLETLQNTIQEAEDCMLGFLFNSLLQISRLWLFCEFCFTLIPLIPSDYPEFSSVVFLSWLTVFPSPPLHFLRRFSFPGISYFGLTIAVVYILYIFFFNFLFFSWNSSIECCSLSSSFHHL